VKQGALQIFSRHGRMRLKVKSPLPIYENFLIPSSQSSPCPNRQDSEKKLSGLSKFSLATLTHQGRKCAFFKHFMSKQLLIPFITRTNHSKFLQATAAVLLLAAVAVTPSVLAQQEPAQDALDLPALLEGEGATGDWFGGRDWLEDRGIDFFGSYTAEVWGNVSGGEQRGAVYTGLLDFGVTLDFEDLIGWKGASFHNSWLWLSGQGPSDQLVGDNLFAVSNIEGFATFRMFELWFQQNLLDDAISLRFGQLAADEEFAISEYAELFLNGTFGWPAFLSESIPNGGPGYPLATPGIRLKVNPAEWLTFRAAVFQGDPFAEDVNRHGFRYRLDRSNGFLFLNELETRWAGIRDSELAGSFKAGAWFHTANFSDPGDEAIRRYGNTGFYFIFDQALYRPQASPTAPLFFKSSKGGESFASHVEAEESSEGLGSFLRIAFEPPNRNEISFYVDAGLTYQGLIPTRRDDTIGVAVAYGKLSGGAVQGLRDDGAVNPGYEMALEATYQIQVTPWFAIQPDLQYIIRPGGTADFGNAFLLGLRTSIEF